MGAGHRQPSWDGADACLGSGRALDRLFAPRPAPAPRSAGQIPPSDADARGISVWAGGLLEDQHVQSLIRYQPLQPRVLLLELLKLLRHLRIHATELRSPAVVRLLADPQPSADIWNIHALPKIHVSLPKQANDLLCTVSLLHRRTLSNPTRGTRILSQELAQDLGRGSLKAVPGTPARPAWSGVFLASAQTLSSAGRMAASLTRSVRRRPIATSVAALRRRRSTELCPKVSRAGSPGGTAPGYVEEELRGYLECGILCFGFARRLCTGCGTGFVIAFSCKGRGVCPSCNGRHMARDRYASRRSRHPAGTRAAVGDFLHVCATDGVFMPAADGAGCAAPPVFLRVRPITQADLATLTERVRRRMIRWFRLNRLLAAAADILAWEHSGFSIPAECADRAHRRRCAELLSELGASPAVLRPGHTSANRSSRLCFHLREVRPPNGPSSSRPTTTATSFRRRIDELPAIDINSL